MSVDLDTSEKMPEEAVDPLLEEIRSGKKIVVDAFLWHKLAYQIMINPRQFGTPAYTPHAIMIALGRIRAGKEATSEECQKLWEETKTVISEHQKNGG